MIFLVMEINRVDAPERGLAFGSDQIHGGSLLKFQVSNFLLRSTSHGVLRLLVLVRHCP